MLVRLQAATAARGLAAGRRVVEVELGRVRRDVLHVVGLAGVEVLHQVIPLAPTVHLARAPACGVRAELDDAIVPHFAVGQELGVAPGGEGLLLVLALPHEHQHVAVWERGYVVVRQAREARQSTPRPDELVVPGHLLQVARRATGGELWRKLEVAAVSQQVAARQQVSHEDLTPRCPGVQHAALLIDEVRRARDREERVAGAHAVAAANHAHARMRVGSHASSVLLMDMPSFVAWSSCADELGCQQSAGERRHP